MINFPWVHNPKRDNFAQFIVIANAQLLIEPSEFVISYVVLLVIALSLVNSLYMFVGAFNQAPLHFSSGLSPGDTVLIPTKILCYKSDNFHLSSHTFFQAQLRFFYQRLQPDQI